MRHTFALSAATLAGALVAGTAPRPAAAQPTATNLGTYVVCMNRPGQRACHEVGLTTAARMGAGGRTGTLVDITLRNLQGSAYTTPGGQAVNTGSGASVLISASFTTQGCIPFQTCGPKAHFGRPDLDSGFGTTESSGALAASAVGTIAGVAPTWQTYLEKPVSGDSPSVLRLNHPTMYDRQTGPMSYVRPGIGGCATGAFPDASNSVVSYGQDARTCAEQGFGGAVRFGVATNFFIDADMFRTLSVDWYAYDEAAGAGLGTQRYSCLIGVGPGGVSGGGDCTAYAVTAAASTVPEPGTWALLGAGLAALAGAAASRRRAA